MEDNDDDDDGNGPRPPGTPSPPSYDFPLYRTSLRSPPMSDDETEQMPAAREKVAVAEKLKFSEKLNKLFSKFHEIFNKNDDQKSLFDDAESLNKPNEMTILKHK